MMNRENSLLVLTRALFVKQWDL